MQINEKFNVSQSKVRALLAKIKKLGIKLSDIEENISKGGGKGGQKINKTSNKVRLHHVPTGVTAVSQKERQRNINRFLALRELVDRIEERLFPKESLKVRKIERIKRKKDRGKRRFEKKMLSRELKDYDSEYQH